MPRRTLAERAAIQEQVAHLQQLVGHIANVKVLSLLIPCKILEIKLRWQRIDVHCEPMSKKITGTIWVTVDNIQVSRLKYHQLPNIPKA